MLNLSFSSLHNNYLSKNINYYKLSKTCRDHCRKHTITIKIKTKSQDQARIIPKKLSITFFCVQALLDWATWFEDQACDILGQCHSSDAIKTKLLLVRNAQIQLPGWQNWKQRHKKMLLQWESSTLLIFHCIIYYFFFFTIFHFN